MMNAKCWWTEAQVKSLQKRLIVVQSGILNQPTWDAVSSALGGIDVEKPKPKPDENNFYVKDHWLYEYTVKVNEKHTPNISSGTIDPILIVIHYTGDNSLQGALSWLTTKGSQVSAHLVIAKTGQVWQLAPFNRRCWHAGKSEYNGRVDVNSFSIGIENVGLGDEWPEAQIQANIDVIKALCAAYNIADLVGHDEVAIPEGRKADPGPKYPWKRVGDACGFHWEGV